jgi:hypothetical protein
MKLTEEEIAELKWEKNQDLREEDMQEYYIEDNY